MAPPNPANSSNGADHGFPQELDPAATLAAWRERGDDRLDPVRFHFLEALARRAATHGGEVRRVLDDKLATLLASHAAALGELRTRRADDGPAATRGDAQAPSRSGPLAKLTGHIAQQGSSRADGPAASHAVPGHAAPAPELKALEYFRSTWSRLSAERRLTQSLAKVPENAGPLNSQHLVQRSLTLMHELSPAYLHRFMAWVDALTWLEQANASRALPATDAPRADGPKPRKPGRAKAG